MAFRIGRLKLVYLFVIFGIGLFAWTILDQTAINRARQNKQDDEKKLPLKSTTSSVTSSQFMLSRPSHKLENVTSSEPTPLTTTAEATESKFLKLPQNLESSWWLNPCEDKKDAKWKMVFVVKSTVDHGPAREILRRTWASVSYAEEFSFTSVFIIGKANGKKQALIDEEYKRYGDILQLNMSDEYRFITQKTLGGMEWSFEHLSDDVFYTSCDDDFMINMAGLIDVMQRNLKMVNASDWSDFPIVCTYKARVSDVPYRNKKSKYYISEEEFKWPYYPDYCLGGAYTTNVGVVRQLWEAAQGLAPLRMDDVWITGVLRERIGMPRDYIRKLDESVATHHKGFSKALKMIKRDQMREEWETEKEKMKNLTTCFCSKL